MAERTVEIKSIPINTQGRLHSRASVYVTGWEGFCSFSCITSLQRDVDHYSSPVNKHLDQVPGNRLPHNARLFAARVALMPAVMNQQLKGSQIYTRCSVTLTTVWLKPADKAVGRAVCLGLTSCGNFSAGHLAPFVVNDWSQSHRWQKMGK